MRTTVLRPNLVNPREMAKILSINLTIIRTHILFQPFSSLSATLVVQSVVRRYQTTDQGRLKCARKDLPLALSLLSVCPTD